MKKKNPLSMPMYSLWYTFCLEYRTKRFIYCTWQNIKGQSVNPGFLWFNCPASGRISLIPWIFFLDSYVILIALKNRWRVESKLGNDQTGDKLGEEMEVNRIHSYKKIATTNWQAPLSRKMLGNYIIKELMGVCIVPLTQNLFYVT